MEKLAHQLELLEQRPGRLDHEGPGGLVTNDEWQARHRVMCRKAELLVRRTETQRAANINVPDNKAPDIWEWAAYVYESLWYFDTMWESQMQPLLSRIEAELEGARTSASTASVGPSRSGVGASSRRKDSKESASQHAVDATESAMDGGGGRVARGPPRVLPQNLRRILDALREQRKRWYEELEKSCESLLPTGRDLLAGLLDSQYEYANELVAAEVSVGLMMGPRGNAGVSAAAGGGWGGAKSAGGGAGLAEGEPKIKEPVVKPRVWITWFNEQKRHRVLVICW